MDISTEIAAIQAASQGSELRQPLVGALNKLNSGSLPAVTVSDVGKILKVGANGWEVGEKSGYMPVPTATKQITENGTHDVTNYASAVVNVSGGGGSSSVLVPKTITQNGTYDPTDDNADGYSEVIVNVSAGGVTSLQYNLGRLAINTGVIEENSAYCYSDLIPISTSGGNWFIDLARSDVNSYYIGISFYASDGETTTGYIRQYETYRSYMASVNGARYFRIANKVSNLSFANVSFLVDGIFIVPQAANVYRTNST